MINNHLGYSRNNDQQQQQQQRQLQQQPQQQQQQQQLQQRGRDRERDQYQYHHHHHHYNHNQYPNQYFQQHTHQSRHHPPPPHHHQHHNQYQHHNQAPLNQSNHFYNNQPYHQAAPKFQQPSQQQQQQQQQHPRDQQQQQQQREQYYKGYHPASSINHRFYNSAFSSKAIEDRQDVVFRRVRGILNKITPETFDKLSKELVNVGLDSPRTLRGVIYLLFDKVLKDLKYSSLYAKLCQELSEKAPNFEQDLNGPNTFCKFLISKCEDEFDRRRKATEDFDHKNELTDEEFELKAIAKQKMLGNIKFICELGKKRLLQKEILHECIKNLLSKKKEQPIQEQAQDLECLCQIMRTIGSLLDINASKNLMNQYFERIDLFSRKPELPSRIRFMLKDIIDLRNNNWRPRTYQREDNVPQPLSKLREEAGPMIGGSVLIDKLSNSRSLIGISDLLKMNGNKLSILLDDDGPSFTTTTDFHYGSSSFLPLDQFETSDNLRKTATEVRQTHGLQATPPKNVSSIANKPNQFHSPQQTPSSSLIRQDNHQNHNHPPHHHQQQHHHNQISHHHHHQQQHNVQNQHSQQVIGRNSLNNISRNNRSNTVHNIEKPTSNIVPAGPVPNAAGLVGAASGFGSRENRRYIQKPCDGVDFSLRPSHNLINHRSLSSNRPKPKVESADEQPQMNLQQQATTRTQGDNVSHQQDMMKPKIPIESVQSLANKLSSASLKNEPNKVEQAGTIDQDRGIIIRENHNRNAARDFHVNKFKSVLIDCFNDASTNFNRTASKVKELKIPKSYQQDCLINAIKQAILKTESERDNLGKLLFSLIPSTFESQSLLNAFKVIFEQMHALEVETPKIKSLVAGLLARAIYDNLLTLEELSIILAGGKHHPLFLLFLQKLEQSAGQAWLNDKFIGSKINLMDMLPEADRSKDRLASILKDRNLGFLDPMLTIEPELWLQMKDKDPSPAGMYRWIKDNVNQTIQTTPTFAHILIKCLLKYIHSVAIEKAKLNSTTIEQSQEQQVANENDDESTSNKLFPNTSSQQNINDLEKEILSKYQQVLQAILNDKKMQLASLYALQSFYYNLDFPKGSLLRWFHMMYDMNIVDDDIFFIWKEQINDEYPGKGQALFQVNTWLNWLAEAESEEEEEDEEDEENNNVEGM